MARRCPSPRCCSVTPSRPCTAVPEYGGNANLVGWQDIKLPGDNQPRGYTDAEVEAPEWNGADTSGIIEVLLRGGWEQAIAKMGGTGGVNAGN